MPSTALEELEDVDIICRGEGEIVAKSIAECVEANKPLSSINNITFRMEGRIVDSPRSLDRATDLDDYPSPYLEGIINLEDKDEVTSFDFSRMQVHMSLLHLTPTERKEGKSPFDQQSP